MADLKKENETQDVYNEIANLKTQLSSDASPIGDWKGIKQREYKDMGLEQPYTDDEMLEYHKQRQSVRAKINELQEKLK